MSLRDFKFLLESKFVYSHKLLAKTIRPVEGFIVPKTGYMKPDFKIVENKKLIDLSLQMASKDRTKEQKSLEKRADNVLLNKFDGRVEYRSEIEVSSPDLILDFSLGSMESVALLTNYSQSPSADFILSDWKYFILNKWNYYKIPYVGKSWLFAESYK